ncbi:hypothetical protein AB0J52_16615 [Spirillospora sp. NPDC049652]
MCAPSASAGPATAGPVHARDLPGSSAQSRTSILAGDALVAVAGRTVEITKAAWPESRPSISLRKWVRPHTYHRAGQRLEFRYKVTNTGHVPMDRVEVEDHLRGLSRVWCPRNIYLRPGASLHCTATYRVTRRDVRKRCVQNCAVATGRNPATGRYVRSNRACARAYGHVPVTG